ncbi:unnamed protein product [Schistosoma spindalis]|nr:unnamed protein product [Schistosoma spindale]
MLSHTVSTKCIREFCQVTGSDEETARSFLSACNNNLELAVSLYMDDPSRVSPQGPTEEYRTPIPQRNEQLLPVVVPLLPVHLQNSPLLQTRRRAFVAEDSDDNSDDDTVTSGVRYQSFEKSQLASKSDHSIKQRCSNDNGSDSNLLNTDGTSSGSSSLSSGHINGVKDGVKRKRKHLQQLYQPPVEILFDGTVQAAELAAQEKNQWLLISIHDEGCFECHLLNRDVWKDPKIYQLIKRHCTFVQIPVDSSEGLRFRSSYSYVQSASHIAILDPFTGEQKMMWTHLNDPKIVYDVLYQFIQHTALTNPNNNTNVINTTAINNGQYGSSIGSINLTGNGRTDSTSIDNRFTNTVPQTGIRRRPPEAANAEMHQQFIHLNLKRPRLQTSDNLYSSDAEYIDLSNSVHSFQVNSTTTSPLDLTEEEQLQLAIEASKKDTKRELFSDDYEVVLTDDEDDNDDDNHEEYMNGNRRLGTDIDQQHRDHEQDKKQYTHITYEDDDRVVVNYPKKPNSSSFVSSTTAFITARRPLRPSEKLNKSTSNNDLKSDILTVLPTPAPDEAVMELLFRLPDGSREVHRLHPTLKLQDLHSYFEYRGYPISRYEIVRIHPNLCLSSMHQSISLTVAGLCTKDTLFIQER